MNSSLIQLLINTLFTLLPNSIIKPALNALFDTVEKFVKESSNQIDDYILLPLITKLRVEVNGNPNLPGDYDSRVKGYYAYAQKYNYILTAEDIAECEKIIKAPGIWQAEIEKYIQSKLGM